MKRFVLILVCLISLRVIAQDQRPQKVVSFIDVTWDSDYYEQLQKEWKALVDKDSKDAEAWENYYLAAMYKFKSSGFYKDSIQKGSTDELHNIMKEMGKKIPNTFEYNYLLYRDNNKRPKYGKNLEKAYELRPDAVKIYPTLTVYYEMSRDREKKAEVYKRWYKNDKDYSMFKLAFGYNTLMSVEQNAIVLAHGDNQVYPIEILEFGKGVREDVDVIVQPMFVLDDYYENLLKDLDMPPYNKTYDDFKKEFPDDPYKAYYGFIQARINHIIQNANGRPVYFPIQMKSAIIDKFKDSLYLVGTVYKYSPVPFDNIALLRKNFEQKFLLDDLKVNLKKVPDNSTQFRLQTLYFKPLLELYKHYLSSGEIAKANNAKQMILKLASDYGKEADYLDYLSKLEKQINP